VKISPIVGWGLALALATASCAPAAPLAGSEWQPTRIGGIEVPDGSQMFVGFGAEGNLVGHGGCNRFFGTYELKGSRIEIGPLGATRMACPEAVMKLEARFQGALGTTRQFSRERIDLTLSDAAGVSLVRLRQADAD